MFDTITCNIILGFIFNVYLSGKLKKNNPIFRLHRNAPIEQ